MTKKHALLVLALPAVCLWACGKYQNMATGVPYAPAAESVAGHHRDAPKNTESYDHVTDNPFVLASAEPLSTFSTDVDTASYSNVRRFLERGQLPPKGAVRIEEMLNYFSYDYPEPAAGHPYAIATEVGPAPWAEDHYLLHIGLRARAIPEDKPVAKNLVFLLDVSGSMSSPNKLPLLKRAMKLLVEQLDERDHVAIVVYAGASGVVLPPTSGRDRGTILAALDRLEAGGGTNGAAGIELAYQLAQEHLQPGSANRVILATDGDFNIGTTSQSELVRLIERKRDAGVYLTVLGFGMGNYKDSTLEKLADKGNGNYGYIDTIREARKMLVQEIGGTLVTVAQDVKLQVEFNPKVVGSYRLIGYENRMLHAEDFEDDKTDAGDMGAGHTVTALYEIIPVGVKTPARGRPALKYQKQNVDFTASADSEIATVKTRYKVPGEKVSTGWNVPVELLAENHPPASGDFRFSCAVAAFGMALRESPHRGRSSFDMALELAGNGQRDDYREEFLALVRKAQRLERR